ncbi:CatB-related O-acetyltransferase [Endozoicomonas ascidiicola]|uniref:CatB-related O-acetyltransferase n=1 Tax=Endozoicomonas ascidiicola TaxID=1698521 RepID=UPI00082E2CBF|nr:CatB-related O-acetyltransferase [Endozoicomonas ascidiicola]
MKWIIKRYKKSKLTKKLKALNVKVGKEVLSKKHLMEMESNSSIRDVKLVGDKDHYVKCGCYSYYRSGSIIGSVSIGRFCSISTEVVIGLEKNGHPLNWLSTSPFQYSENDITKLRSHEKMRYDPQMSSTEIGHDVWIGSGVIIYNGCTVNNGAVIAARSVVTKPVPPYAIVAGVPAKIIGYRLKPDLISLIQKSEWWNLPIDIIANLTFDRQAEFTNELKILMLSEQSLVNTRVVKFQTCVEI